MDYFPVPCSVTLCGEPPPLSMMLRDALRLPCALGVKVTPIEQFSPAGSLDPQLLLWAKSFAFLPVMVKAVSTRVVLPTFVSRTIEGGLVVPTFCAGNPIEVGERLTTVAVPDKLIV